MSGLEINPDKFVDMQRKWRVPNNGKKWQSLAEFAASLIHPSYKEMKQKIDKKMDHKLWGISPLPNNLIEYAGVDAYAAYKSWNMIDYITDGWEFAKEREADNYYDCPYCPF